jgi:hypothetical protein
MKILCDISSVDPRGCGPIEGVNQQCGMHCELGVEVEICSLDAPDAEWVYNSPTKVYALGPVI